MVKRRPDASNASQLRSFDNAAEALALTDNKILARSYLNVPWTLESVGNLVNAHILVFAKQLGG